MLFRHLHESGPEEEKDTGAHGENAEEGKDYRQDKYFKIKTFPEEFQDRPFRGENERDLPPKPGPRGSQPE
jgi:hypothetical protein